MSYEDTERLQNRLASFLETVLQSAGYNRTQKEEVGTTFFFSITLIPGEVFVESHGFEIDDGTEPDILEEMLEVNNEAENDVLEREDEYQEPKSDAAEEIGENKEVTPSPKRKSSK